MNEESLIDRVWSFARIEAKFSAPTPDLVDDLLQESAIVIIEVVRRYKNVPEVELERIAKRAIANKMRDLGRRRKAYAKYKQMWAKRDESEHQGFQDVELKELLAFAKLRLGEPESQILESFHKGMEPIMISRKFEIGLSTVYRKFVEATAYLSS